MKHCRWCRTKFNGRLKAVFCSYSCSSYWKWCQPDFRAKQVKKVRRLSNRIRQSRLVRKQWLSRKFRQQQSIRMHGVKPPVGISKPQRTLFRRLGLNWIMEHRVGPYRVDLANVRRRIIIEIDGQWHSSLRGLRKDRKRDRWLRRNGWTVYRVRNDEASTWQL